ncbi:MAG: DUF1501 domain-containing protein [Planctomycetaceae bacterium]
MDASLRFRPVNRRGFLQVGGLGVGGLSLANLNRARAAGVASRNDRAVILFFQAGGASQLDTYDPKPGAAPDIRGPFPPIETTLPGWQCCELLPHHARIARHVSLVRSITHNLSVHDDATHWLQTGYPLLNARQRGQTHPSQGSVVSKMRGVNQRGLPPYVCIPEEYRSHLGFYEGAAYLGQRHVALNAGGDPSLGNYRPPEFTPPTSVTLPQLEDRQQLLRSLDRLARGVELCEGWGEYDEVQREALRLTTGSAARQAFDLTGEPASVRERYGRHAYGQSALLARRLVEAGVTFVTINLYEKDVDWWDDHSNIENNLRVRLPRYDQALATLIEDLHERGLSERVLVAAFGEFGRAPRIDAAVGRGHWPRAMSALLAGGGLRAGQVVGATTADGGEPSQRPLGPGDLLATIYHSLGIDHRATLPDRQNRPIPLVPEGDPIRELI